MIKFLESAHYQTDYSGKLRHDEIMVIIELLKETREKVSSLSNIITVKKIISSLMEFDKIE